jgi:NAD(P)-dependent dehydrogenase (short-subunit alcohol dehydrogenase family)
MQTILITGASSGYGLETARHFLAKGWRVVATMRTPNANVLPQSENLLILPLDVTDEASIAACVAAAGPIDVLLNNAGIGAVGAFEATPMAHIRRIFDTNTFGIMSMIQAVVPQMRERRSGAILNVTSSVTLAPFPLAAAYKASKQAIEGLSESLVPELGHFGIRVKIIEPGYAPTTRFTANNSINPDELIPQDYEAFAAPIFAAFGTPGPTTKESDVAEAAWAAVSDTSGRVHFPAGQDSVHLSSIRKVGG